MPLSDVQSLQIDLARIRGRFRSPAAICLSVVIIRSLYAQIRRHMRDYYVLRGENLFCSITPSATIPERTALSLFFAARKREEFAAS